MHWFQLPQNCCKSENLAPFRDIRMRSQLQPSFLLAPAQLLLLPAGFLMVKGSAKSLRWGYASVPVSPGQTRRQPQPALALPRLTGRRRCLHYWDSVPGSRRAMELSSLLRPWWLTQHLKTLPLSMECCRLGILCWRGRASSVFCGVTPTGDSPHNQREPLND